MATQTTPFQGVGGGTHIEQELRALGSGEGHPISIVLKMTLAFNFCLPAGDLCCLSRCRTFSTDPKDIQITLNVRFT
ncbi:hypothetical protein scyTo_0006291 [Scyliorhinus torazame]|uniref:Uncharacterized protein n=1 Tax=Scyliorhinus torazame TaxID=75743 RepID=A0A401PH00_SCYTO|nr:hypothetical protein [Scyliorhinus torazame]